ncbi:MAG: Crp/Fnr family transcriptional regulator [Polymorphobacter sp.]
MLKSEIAIATSLLLNRGWLAETPSDFSAAVLAHCHWRKVAAGAAIQHAGDVSGGLIGLGSGSITFTTSLATPDAPMVHIAHPGQWFGYVTLFGEPSLVMSTTARSEVILGHISQPVVEQLLSNRPEWWRHVGQLGVMYGNVAANIASDLMIRDSHRRCVAALLRIANCRFRDPGDERRIEAPLSQEELAALSNLSRTSVSNILHDLEAAGTISLNYRSIILNDAELLRKMVDDV